MTRFHFPGIARQGTCTLASEVATAAMEYHYESYFLYDIIELELFTLVLLISSLSFVFSFLVGVKESLYRMMYLVYFDMIVHCRRLSISIYFSQLKMKRWQQNCNQQG